MNTEQPIPPAVVLSTALLSECGIIFYNDSTPPHDPSGCRLHYGHEGPHEFVDLKGTLWQWETDLECDCEHCMQCEGDYCSTYWRADNAI